LSALPPYNPDVADRTIFLLAAGGALDALPGLMGSLGAVRACFADSEDLTLALAELFGGEVRAGLLPRPGNDGLASEGEGDVLVVAAGDRLDAILRGLLGAPDGTATFRFEPGALTEVQVFGTRAVVRHLNQGRAVP